MLARGHLTHLLRNDRGVNMNGVQTVAELRDTRGDLIEVDHLKSSVSLHYVHSLLRPTASTLEEFFLLIQI